MTMPHWRDILSRMGDIFSFRRKKRRFGWLHGITPRRIPRRGRRPTVLVIFFAVLIGAVVGAFVDPRVPTPISIDHGSPQPSQSFSLCFIGGGWNCVVDGDTFWNEGVKIRVADIDAPETHPPRCSYEADLGNRATLRFQELLNQGSFTLQSIERDEDRYGRKLRVVVRDGESLGMRLVNEGLARPWTGSRQPWC